MSEPTIHVNAGMVEVYTPDLPAPFRLHEPCAARFLLASGEIAKALREAVSFFAQTVPDGGKEVTLDIRLAGAYTAKLLQEALAKVEGRP
jgi:hypothetical protein